MSQEMAGNENEEVIRQIVKGLEDGWNNGDGQAFSAPFAEDADYVVVDGRYARGRSVIAMAHQTIFDTIYKGSFNKATVEAVRFIRPDVAVVRVHWHLEAQISGQTRSSDARNTLVVTRDDEEWSITSFQNTPIAPDDSRPDRGMAAR